MISSCCKWTIIWLSLLCVQIFVWWVMYDIKFTNKIYRYHYPVHKWKIMNLQWTINMKNAMLPKHTKWYMQETFLHARLWDVAEWLEGMCHKLTARDMHETLRLGHNLHGLRQQLEACCVCTTRYITMHWEAHFTHVSCMSNCHLGLSTYLGNPSNQNSSNFPSQSWRESEVSIPYSIDSLHSVK